MERIHFFPSALPISQFVHPISSVYANLCHLDDNLSDMRLRLQIFECLQCFFEGENLVNDGSRRLGV